jgi:hypothetical protein
MKIYSKWIVASLIVAVLPVMNCKIIGVEPDQTMMVTVALEHTFRTIAPGNDPHTRTFTPAEYWDDQFNDWDIESAQLTDIQVTCWDVEPAERSVSAKFTLTFVDATPPANPLIGNTQVVTLGECVDNIMNVWNNKVTIDTAGKIRLLKAIQNKQNITLSALVQDLSGSCDFSTKVAIKVQVQLTKK